jgi:peroxiredoxin
MLEAGARAPAFTLPDQNGEKVKLSDLKGGTVVLYFYPRADTAINSIDCRSAQPKPSTVSPA